MSASMPEASCEVDYLRCSVAVGFTHEVMELNPRTANLA
jgi:hypothetical protein